MYRRNFGYRRSSFGYLSKKAFFTPPISIANPKNVFIYADTHIGSCQISALNARFILKRGCAVGSGLRVQTGNHARIIGKFVGEIKEIEKPSGYDKDVIVEEDVWIGTNVTILAGVTIGRGATIAAGAIVTKDIPPYSIAAGIPARPIKFYWDVDQIIEHEKKLYPEDERYTREQIKIDFKQKSNM